MKYLPFILFVILCGVVYGLNAGKSEPKYDYLRVHIRADSNSEADQSIKYIVKDEVVGFVTPYLINCDSKEKSVAVLTELLSEIEDVCNNVLLNNGFTYRAKAKIDEENFPTRVYDNLTLPAGVYDALIIELGSGKGDNWWCIVYPPLCFVNKSDAGAQNIKYQSYLMEIVKKYFSKG